MIKRLLIAIVLLALVGGAIVGFNMFRDKAITDFFANMPVPTATVSTVAVEKRSWTPNIEAIGTISANQGVDLTVETAGVITEINFKANQQVKQGDVLLRLDDAVQRADLEAAKTQAALDQQSLKRAQELQQRGVGSNVSLDTAQAAAQTSTAQVQKLDAVLTQKQLRAPFSGTVGIPRVDVGRYLSPGDAVVTLQDVSTMRADFTVPEQRLGQMRIDQPVIVTLDGQDGEFKGKITGIDPKIDPASRLVSIRAAIENPDNVLTPGQFARIKVQLPAENDIIILPQTAVVTSLYGDYVYVVRPMEQKKAEENKEQKEEQGDAAAAAGQPQTPPATQQASQVFVQLGRRNGAEIEVKGGLNVGDQIITAGQNRLSNGTPVAIDNTIDPAKSGEPTQVSQQ
ncbi:efflux RND transporter periplasmic adaptor subunit [Tianweitania populi]|uniref:MexH family multidrug efflux RND transporter periplasmic adaptor subunit n=1 Tax=Tianweitania populi TaxID=1607949 RepID=A0A8J3GL74_9HYPH|nr:MULTISPECIES: efflux RND transporter periplasmic adaptor subunit [Tianweitania]GHD16043.1 MexH family multidrug efflux RND transporter periplasmic adaptor subunit [Tianweitania populi]